MWHSKHVFDIFDFFRNLERKEGLTAAKTFINMSLATSTDGQIMHMLNYYRTWFKNSVEPIFIQK